MMHTSYLVVIVLVFLVSFLLDLFVTKLFTRYFSKLVLVLTFLYVVFLVRIYMGVKMGLWSYGEGILGNKIYAIPIEEYIFMGVAPYGTIVLWETFHKLSGKIRRKKTK